MAAGRERDTRDPPEGGCSVTSRSYDSFAPDKKQNGPRGERHDIGDDLKARAVELVSSLLGSGPNRARSNGRATRWGRKGSFALAVTGPKCGCWYDHEAQEGGGLISLIAKRATGGDVGKAARWAWRWLRGDGQPTPTGEADRDRGRTGRQTLSVANARRVPPPALPCAPQA